MKIYIYLILNTINNKRYFGQTSNIKDRWKQHCRVNKVKPSIIQLAIKKYGKENFDFSIIAEYDSDEEATGIETKLIAEHKTTDRQYGYNISKGGPAFFRGLRHSEETKAKIGDNFRGKPRSPESIEKYKQSRMEDPDIQQQVIADYRSGLTIRDIRNKYNFGGNGKVYRILDLNNIDRLNNFNSWTGKTHSEETRAKMKIAAQERWASEETNKSTRNRTSLSQEQITEIGRKYESGATTTQLSGEYNCSRAYILKVIKKLGIQIRG